MIETILGVATGLIGNIVTSVSNYKTTKLKNEHEVDMMGLEMQKMEVEKDIMLAEAEANMKITEVETQASIELADSDIYKEVVKESNKKLLDNNVISKLFESKWTMPFGVIISFLFGLVDFIRTAIRPALTFYLVGLTSWLTYTAYTIIIQNERIIPTLEAIGIFTRVTDIIIYLTVSCVTWWFGDRATAKFLMKLNK